MLVVIILMIAVGPQEETRLTHQQSRGLMICSALPGLKTIIINDM